MRGGRNGYGRAALKGGGKHVDAGILQGICKGQETEKNACILGQNEVAP